MNIKKVSGTDSYYVADNGFLYRRHASDNKLHKITPVKTRSQYQVRFKRNGKMQSFSIGRLIAEYFLNAHGNYHVYRVDKNKGFNPGNLKVKYNQKEIRSYDCTPKPIKAYKNSDLHSMIFESVYEAVRYFDVADSTIRSIIDTPKEYKGFLFKTIN